jgi:hypothetical protein
MASKKDIIERLPALVADRADPMKLETAIRYVGDIIFDASQDRGGEKATWVTEVLSDSSSPEEVHVREAIFAFFRDGHLDRYTDFSVWRDIALAARISSEPASIYSLGQASVILDTPGVTVEPQAFSAPTASIAAAAEEPERAESVEALKLIIPTLSENERTRMLETESETASGETIELPIKPEPFESERTRNEALLRASEEGELRDSVTDVAGPLEITFLEGAERNPYEFAEKIKENRAGKLWEMGFACLIRFVPRISPDGRSVEWADPATADSFRDHGHRLTCDSPSGTAIRAMLELAQAANWTRVTLNGCVRVEALARYRGSAKPPSPCKSTAIYCRPLVSPDFSSVVGAASGTPT